MYFVLKIIKVMTKIGTMQWFKKKQNKTPSVFLSGSSEL